MGKLLLLTLLLTSCHAEDPEHTVVTEGGPDPVICIKRVNITMCRDGSGAFWFCRHSPDICVLSTFPAELFALKAKVAEKVGAP